MAIYVKFYLPKPFLGGNEVRFIEQHWPLKTSKGVEKSRFTNIYGNS